MRKQAKVIWTIAVIAIIVVGAYMYFGENTNGFLAGNKEEIVKTDVSNTINGFFKELKNGNLDNASKYLINDNKYANLDLNFKDKSYEDIMKRLVSKLNYSIENVTVNDYTAKARLNITSVDLLSFYNTYSSEINPLVQSYLNGGASQKVDAENKIKALLNDKVGKDIDSGNYQKLNGSIDVNLKNVNGKWLIEPNQDLIYYLTGKMTSIMNK
ncbi:hypothetical protein [Clostridium arbusti]|uniref:hypothetical protein n=1 Tax=Clostridium arbusti TaxID=1137848 RepID=UPI000288A981|nr:hypothetical protein [Clostridium arbusti]